MAGGKWAAVLESRQKEMESEIAFFIKKKKPNQTKNPKPNEKEASFPKKPQTYRAMPHFFWKHENLCCALPYGFGDPCRKMLAKTSVLSRLLSANRLGCLHHSQNSAVLPNVLCPVPVGDFLRLLLLLLFCLFTLCVSACSCTLLHSPHPLLPLCNVS